MMFSRINFPLRRFNCKHPSWNCRFRSSTVPEAKDEKDPAGIFFDRHVQQLLTTLTRVNIQKVFVARQDGTPLTVPKFQFMTEEELQETQARIGERARGRIQMPPVVKKRPEKGQLLSEDPALENFTKSNDTFVFTDISVNCNNRNRLIVVREANGTLRHASPNERHRMNQVYFPIRGREVHTPMMFYDPHLNDLLKREEFVFILDRACLQFDPDDPEYHRITEKVYSYLNMLEKFDMLRSTRHFGPFAFHLAWTKNIDTLLMDLIKTENIEEAVALIRLYHRIHPEAKSAKEPISNDTDLIRAYVELDSTERYKITRAIDAQQKLRNHKEMVQKGVMKAHGFVDENIEQT